ncbi:MAG: hypothetical protein LN413_00130 [Candidatus Thermoplasmatota archaeon]|nr:hypothetical protein [Candidatus Thermoplasmatota archaeon]
MPATAKELICEGCGKSVDLRTQINTDGRQGEKICPECLEAHTKKIGTAAKEAGAKSQRGRQQTIPGSGQQKHVDIEHEGHKLLDLREEKKNAVDAVKEEHDGEIEAQEERMKTVMKEHDITHYHDPETGLEIDLDEKVKVKRKTDYGTGVS